MKDDCYEQAMESHRGKWSARAAQQTAKCRKRKGTVKKTKAGQNLKRWEKEKWTDQDGKPCGARGARGARTPVKCRPSKKVSKKTPVTWKEMSPSRKKQVVSEKKKVGMGKKTSPIRRSISSGNRKTSPRGSSLSSPSLRKEKKEKNLSKKKPATPPSKEEFERRKERQLLYKPFPSHDGKTKYTVYVKDGKGGKKPIKFGYLSMQHYFDKIGYYSSKNHYDKDRLKRFQTRFKGKYDPNDKDNSTWWSWRKLW